MPPRRSNIAGTVQHKSQPSPPASGQTTLETKFKLTIDLTPDQRRQLTAYLGRKAEELDRSRVQIGKAIVAMMTAAFTDEHTDQVVTDLLR